MLLISEYFCNEVDALQNDLQNFLRRELSLAVKGVELPKQDVDEEHLLGRARHIVVVLRRQVQTTRSEGRRYMQKDGAGGKVQREGLSYQCK